MSQRLPQRPPVLLRRPRLALLTGADICRRTRERQPAFARHAAWTRIAAGLDGLTPPRGASIFRIEADLIEEVLRIVGFDAVQEAPRRCRSVSRAAASPASTSARASMR